MLCLLFAQCDEPDLSDPCPNGSSSGKAHIALFFPLGISRNTTNPKDACAFIPELKCEPKYHSGSRTLTTSGTESSKYFCEVVVRSTSCFTGVRKSIINMDRERSFVIEAPNSGPSTVADITFYEACNSCTGGYYDARVLYTCSVADLWADGYFAAWLNYDSYFICN